MHADQDQDPDLGFEIFADPGPRFDIFADPVLDVFHKIVCLREKRKEKNFRSGSMNSKMWIRILNPAPFDDQELGGETMALLLSYIYTGQVQDFTNVSVVDLFKAADR